MRASTSCAHESGWLTEVLVVGNIIHFDVFAHAREYDKYSYELGMYHPFVIYDVSFFHFIHLGWLHTCVHAARACHAHVSVYKPTYR